MNRATLTRRACVASSAAVAGSLLAACSGAERQVSKPAAQGPVTIRARHKSPGFDIWEQMIAEYNARSTGIQIALENAPAGMDHHDKIAVEIAGGVAPDVFEMESKRMPSFANGRLLDLTRRFQNSKKAARSVFWPNDYDRAVWGGKQFLLPQFDNPGVIYYHSGLFQKRGVPLPPDKPGATWTWATFLDTARRLTNPGEGTFGFTQNEWWVYLEPWVWMNGGDFLSKDRTQVILDQPAALEAITFAVETRTRHRVNPLAADIKAAGNVDNLFFAGSLGMSHNICNWTDTVRRRPDVPWNIAPVPQGAKSYAPRSPATMWAMWSETKQPDRAFEVFEHFASAEVHRQIPMVPSRRDVSESGQFMFATTIPGLRWQVFAEAKKAARDDPSTAAFQEMDRLMMAEQGKLWAGDYTAKDFVAAFKGPVEKLLSDAERTSTK